jgi:hypothetical protein
MSSANEKSFRDVLATLREKKEGLFKEIQQIIETEKFLAAQIDEPLQDESSSLHIQIQLRDKPKHEAARIALLHLRDPATISDIADWLIEHGSGQKSQKKKLMNTLLISMQRKKDFCQLDDGSWALTEWDV